MCQKEALVMEPIVGGAWMEHLVSYRTILFQCMNEAIVSAADSR